MNKKNNNLQYFCFINQIRIFAALPMLSNLYKRSVSLLLLKQTICSLENHAGMA